MQVEPEDFILSLDVDSNENTEIVTTEVSELPPDLVNADVSDFEKSQGFAVKLLRASPAVVVIKQFAYTNTSVSLHNF